MAKINIFKKRKLINPGNITINQEIKAGLKKINQKRKKIKAIKEEIINKRKSIIRKNCISRKEFMKTKVKKHIENLKMRSTQKDIISIKTKNIKITIFTIKENMIKKKVLIKIDIIIDKDNTLKNIRRIILKTNRVSRGINSTITKIREDNLIQIKEKVGNKEDLKIRKIHKEYEKDKIKRMV